ncbi:Glycine/D-amino acid oxidase [Paramicrobacterium humi]|uniref:Glycine/D-amino acid oxidase n=1 Tax=Paramicrobacterium humi TaxID=640635 RepID=A0A1H4Q1I8_9MICO|nr:FAD-dependent oxidoreductase [Microbacterium humi]SEC13506.1 Glycine/D-amino acid oxidase [Microbacterium humi]
MTSLWLARHELPPSDPLDRLDGAEDIIVGAGLTGLVTALLLARAGRRVAVLEARTLAAVTTGNTTAKLSLLQGARLQEVQHRTTQRVARAYLDANRAGMDWLTEFIGDAGVPMQRRQSVSYAATDNGAALIDREYRVARSLGLPVTRLADAGLPFPTRAAIGLADQAQFDPLDVALALAAELRTLGGTIHEGVRVRGAKAGRPVVVHTSVGDVTGSTLTLASGTPVLDRGLYFAKLEAKRSYAASYAVNGPLPAAMSLSVDQPTHSIRTTPSDDGGELLLVGGLGHGVGRHPSPASRVAHLDEWTQTHWPGARRTHVWSAQDYESPHGVPFVGHLPRGRGRVYLATGYDKWGMANSAQCALTLAATMLGELPDWARVLHHRITTPVALARGLGMGAAVARHYATGWAGALRSLPADAPREGQGAVGREGIRLVADSCVDGTRHRVSPVCTHMGAILSWNDQEKSWDCPAHGSRFTADGCRLEGPACRDLRRK